MPTFTVTDERMRSKRDQHPTRTKTRAVVQSSPTTFHAIDSEGAGTGDDHRLVLVRCGRKYISNPFGIKWDEVFEFLYSQFEPGPRHAYVGFYLGYDFTQWLRTLTAERAWRLLSKPGKASRKRKVSQREDYFPVECGQWEFDLLGTKRLRIRPKRSKLPWMNICDVGGFFQSSFLTAIDPSKWSEPILTDEEYATIEEGKTRRSDAYLDDEMIEYNRLECDVLERLMSSVENGLITMGIRLKPSQWFGPGQVAQAWLKSQNAITTTDVWDMVEEHGSSVGDFFLAARESYFGGWFEIMAHGIIPGESYSYDINSAYPYVIAHLPCLRHGRYYSGNGEPNINPDSLCLVRASVYAKQSRYEDSAAHDLGSRPIGAMLHRDRTGKIARPFATRGYYWFHELQAAMRAGIIVEIEYHSWLAYDPCNCPPPLANVADLYLQRLSIDKNSPLGKSIKLLINSIYGKFAQSVGNPLYGNPVYASLITAGCRTMILDAIATHPGGPNNVLMVATDGVYFLDPHPALPISSVLGQWEESIHRNLCLYKPGVYWDDSGRDSIAEGKSPKFKARGVRASDFARAIPEIDAKFRSWPKGNKDGTCRNMAERSEWKKRGSGWPHIKIKSSFSMVSMTQAIQPGWNWEKAGHVSENVELEQSAWNGSKRGGLWYDPERDIYRSKPLGDEWDVWPRENHPYEKKFGLDDPWSDESKDSHGISPDGAVKWLIMEAIPAE